MNYYLFNEFNNRFTIINLFFYVFDALLRKSMPCLLWQVQLIQPLQRIIAHVVAGLVVQREDGVGDDWQRYFMGNVHLFQTVHC